MKCQQNLEKMISGMYLPETVRLIVADFAAKTPLFAT
jgi:hexokinase